jgi:hypothetical protein
LPRDVVEPIVVVNGSSDRTADVANEFGCKVLDLPEQGKLPAIQASLRYLGERALEPIMILDADTRPVFPRLWHRGMLRNLQTSPADIPEAVGAPIWYTEADIVNASLRSVLRYAKALKLRAGPVENDIAQSGPNMGIHIKRQETLDQVLELPHYWPGEDKAIIFTVLSNNGHLAQPTSPSVLALTPLSTSLPRISEILRVGSSEARARMFDNYTKRGAPNSQRYIQE